MPPEGSSQTTVNPPPRILESRTQYQPCHIRVPDLDARVAAIRVNGKFYSLLKLVKERQQALEIANRLANKGEEAVITATIKGDAIWVLEREAYLDLPAQTDLAPTAQATGIKTSSATAKVLESRNKYRPCHIRVPDLEHRLSAIAVEGQYYSFFKVVKDRAQALEVAARLSRRGDQTVITSSVKGDVVWVLEPDAELDFRHL
ncbi:hypothetical protein [Trichocoleus sp. FACHB-591]|uniref:hypothetical protein n=1 Tax=Trichocoleus sp. FACHB-591 TaxID=2692872 RepID=UPI0018EFDEF9|nr:hypothetical protein [Trichocoleus sp. FACHB-591]